MANQKIKMTVAGMEFSVTTDDEPEYMTAIGEEVNQKVMRLLRENDNISVTMATTLAAMEYCDMYIKSESNSDNLRNQMKEYFEETAHIRAELGVARREAERLSAENQSLRERLQNRGIK